MHEVKIPKVLFLALDIASFYKNSFFNTNDLVKIANQYKKELVRRRVDKTDYKYLEDTNFGGLRGNFSTLLTWRGLVKRGSRIVSTYSLGRDKRLINAVCNGEIILDRAKLVAYTNNEKLKQTLENEAWLLNTREKQAHIKIMLQGIKHIPLKRDNINYPKESVVQSSKKQCFLRAIINNFFDNNKKIIEYRLINYWQGNKFKIKNLHILLILPTENDPWNKIYAIKSEDLYSNKPVLLRVNLETQKCFDEKNNSYKIYPLEVALMEFSDEDANKKNRLDYKWSDLNKTIYEYETEDTIKKEDEFSNFLRNFLDWNKNFCIDNKQVVDIKIISSGGPDVELQFSGGTTQLLELEHQWKNYLNHGHHKNHAFNNVWIYADEEIDEDKIIKLYSKEKKIHGARIPDILLGHKNGKPKAYKINWDSDSFEELELHF